MSTGELERLEEVRRPWNKGKRLAGMWKEWLHPRDRRGRFIDVAGKVTKGILKLRNNEWYSLQNVADELNAWREANGDTRRVRAANIWRFTDENGNPYWELRWVDQDGNSRSRRIGTDEFVDGRGQHNPDALFDIIGAELEDIQPDERWGGGFCGCGCGSALNRALHGSGFIPGHERRTELEGHERERRPDTPETRDEKRARNYDRVREVEDSEEYERERALARKLNELARQAKKDKRAMRDTGRYRKATKPQKEAMDAEADEKIASAERRAAKAREKVDELRERIKRAKKGLPLTGLMYDAEDMPEWAKGKTIGQVMRQKGRGFDPQGNPIPEDEWRDVILGIARDWKEAFFPDKNRKHRLRDKYAEARAAWSVWALEQLAENRDPFNPEVQRLHNAPRITLTNSDFEDRGLFNDKFGKTPLSVLSEARRRARESGRRQYVYVDPTRLEVVGRNSDGTPIYDFNDPKIYVISDAVHFANDDTSDFIEVDGRQVPNLNGAKANQQLIFREFVSTDGKAYHVFAMQELNREDFNPIQAQMIEGEELSDAELERLFAFFRFQFENPRVEAFDRKIAENLGFHIRGRHEKHELGNIRKVIDDLDKQVDRERTRIADEQLDASQLERREAIKQFVADAIGRQVVGDDMDDDAVEALWSQWLRLQNYINIDNPNQDAPKYDITEIITGLHRESNGRIVDLFQEVNQNSTTYQAARQQGIFGTDVPLEVRISYDGRRLIWKTSDANGPQWHMASRRNVNSNWGNKVTKGGPQQLRQEWARDIIKSQLDGIIRRANKIINDENDSVRQEDLRRQLNNNIEALRYFLYEQAARDRNRDNQLWRDKRAQDAADRQAFGDALGFPREDDDSDDDGFVGGVDDGGSDGGGSGGPGPRIEPGRPRGRLSRGIGGFLGSNRNDDQGFDSEATNPPPEGSGGTDFDAATIPNRDESDNPDRPSRPTALEQFDAEQDTEAQRAEQAQRGRDAMAEIVGGPRLPAAIQAQMDAADRRQREKEGAEPPADNVPGSFNPLAEKEKPQYLFEEPGGGGVWVLLDNTKHVLVDPEQGRDHDVRRFRIGFLPYPDGRKDDVNWAAVKRVDEDGNEVMDFAALLQFDYDVPEVQDGRIKIEWDISGKDLEDPKAFQERVKEIEREAREALGKLREHHGLVEDDPLEPLSPEEIAAQEFYLDRAKKILNLEGDLEDLSLIDQDRVRDKAAELRAVDEARLDTDIPEKDGYVDPDDPEVQRKIQEIGNLSDSPIEREILPQQILDAIRAQNEITADEVVEEIARQIVDFHKENPATLGKFDRREMLDVDGHPNAKLTPELRDEWFRLQRELAELSPIDANFEKRKEIEGRLNEINELIEKHEGNNKRRVVGRWVRQVEMEVPGEDGGRKAKVKHVAEEFVMVWDTNLNKGFLEHYRNGEKVEFKPGRALEGGADRDTSRAVGQGGFFRVGANGEFENLDGGSVEQLIKGKLGEKQGIDLWKFTHTPRSEITPVMGTHVGVMEWEVPRELDADGNPIGNRVIFRLDLTASPDRGVLYRIEEGADDGDDLVEDVAVGFDENGNGPDGHIRNVLKRLIDPDGNVIRMPEPEPDRDFDPEPDEMPEPPADPPPAPEAKNVIAKDPMGGTFTQVIIPPADVPDGDKKDTPAPSSGGKDAPSGGSSATHTVVVKHVDSQNVETIVAEKPITGQNAQHVLDEINEIVRERIEEMEANQGVWMLREGGLQSGLKNIDGDETQVMRDLLGNTWMILKSKPVIDKDGNPKLAIYLIKRAPNDAPSVQYRLDIDYDPNTRRPEPGQAGRAFARLQAMALQDQIQQRVEGLNLEELLPPGANFGRSPAGRGDMVFRILPEGADVADPDYELRGWRYLMRVGTLRRPDGTTVDRYAVFDILPTEKDGKEVWGFDMFANDVTFDSRGDRDRQTWVRDTVLGGRRQNDLGITFKSQVARRFGRYTLHAEHFNNDAQPGPQQPRIDHENARARPVVPEEIELTDADLPEGEKEFTARIEREDMTGRPRPHQIVTPMDPDATIVGRAAKEMNEVFNDPDFKPEVINNPVEVARRMQRLLEDPDFARTTPGRLKSAQVHMDDQGRVYGVFTFLVSYDDEAPPQEVMFVKFRPEGVHAGHMVGQRLGGAVEEGIGRDAIRNKQNIIWDNENEFSAHPAADQLSADFEAMRTEEIDDKIDNLTNDEQRARQIAERRTSINERPQGMDVDIDLQQHLLDHLLNPERIDEVTDTIDGRTSERRTPRDLEGGPFSHLPDDEKPPSGAQVKSIALFRASDGRLVYGAVLRVPDNMFPPENEDGMKDEFWIFGPKGSVHAKHLLKHNRDGRKYDDTGFDKFDLEIVQEIGPEDVPEGALENRVNFRQAGLDVDLRTLPPVPQDMTPDKKDSPDMPEIQQRVEDDKAVEAMRVAQDIAKERMGFGERVKSTSVYRDRDGNLWVVTDGTDGTARDDRKMFVDRLVFEDGKVVRIERVSGTDADSVLKYLQRDTRTREGNVGKLGGRTGTQVMFMNLNRAADWDFENGVPVRRRDGTEPGELHTTPVVDDLSKPKSPDAPASVKPDKMSEWERRSTDVYTKDDLVLRKEGTNWVVVRKGEDKPIAGAPTRDKAVDKAESVLAVEQAKRPAATEAGDTLRRQPASPDMGRQERPGREGDDEFMDARDIRVDDDKVDEPQSTVGEIDYDGDLPEQEGRGKIIGAGKAAVRDMAGEGLLDRETPDGPEAGSVMPDNKQYELTPDGAWRAIDRAMNQVEDAADGKDVFVWYDGREDIHQNPGHPVGWKWGTQVPEGDGITVFARVPGYPVDDEGKINVETRPYVFPPQAMRDREGMWFDHPPSKMKPWVRVNRLEVKSDETDGPMSAEFAQVDGPDAEEVRRQMELWDAIVDEHRANRKSTLQSLVASRPKTDTPGPRKPLNVHTQSRREFDGPYGSAYEAWDPVASGNTRWSTGPRFEGVSSWSVSYNKERDMYYLNITDDQGVEHTMFSKSKPSVEDIQRKMDYHGRGLPEPEIQLDNAIGGGHGGAGHIDQLLRHGDVLDDDDFVPGGRRDNAKFINLGQSKEEAILMLEQDGWKWDEDNNMLYRDDAVADEVQRLGEEVIGDMFSGVGKDLRDGDFSGHVRVVDGRIDNQYGLVEDKSGNWIIRVADKGRYAPESRPLGRVVRKMNVRDGRQSNVMAVDMAAMVNTNQWKNADADGKREMLMRIVTHEAAHLAVSPDSKTALANLKPEFKGGEEGIVEGLTAAHLGRIAKRLGVGSRIQTKTDDWLKEMMGIGGREHVFSPYKLQVQMHEWIRDALGMDADKFYGQLAAIEAPSRVSYLKVMAALHARGENLKKLQENIGVLGNLAHFRWVRIHQALPIMNLWDKKRGDWGDLSAFAAGVNRFLADIMPDVRPLPKMHNIPVKRGK